jgi:hypothetical protein
MGVTFLLGETSLGWNEMLYCIREKGENMKNMKYIVPALAMTLCAGTAFAAGDGSDEPGFVPPPHAAKLPSAPPRSVSSAETYIAGGCCVPQARTEAKKPPVPPALITKLTE